MTYQPEIYSKEGCKKTYHFWMKTYLIWKMVGGEGVRGALTKKVDPG